MERQMDRQSANLIMLIGVIQGCLLLWLWKSAEWQNWPATSHVALGALLWPALVVPAAWYLSENTGSGVRSRVRLMLLATLSFALLGAYGGWLEEPLQSANRSIRLVNSMGSFAHAVASAVLGFVSLILLIGRRSGAWDYPRLFDLAWRNVMLCTSAASITGLFWISLFAGAKLMEVLGLGFILELIKKPVFIFPVTGLVVAAAFVQGHQRAPMLGIMRQYTLALMAWLLPLMLGFSVMWVAALPSAGVEKLFATGNAAFILLWFVTLSVSFMNSAWQDGRDEPAYPMWLGRGVRYAWLSLVPVVVIAGWALWVRIDQHGFTEHRIWALFVWGLALLYVTGYALSTLKGMSGNWMPTVGRTNIVVAVVMCVGLLLLVTPVADPRRLAAQDQVARLLADDSNPADFDYRYLRWGSARWGLRALESLAVLDSTEREQDIASRARQLLAVAERYGSNHLQTLSTDDLQRRIEILTGPGATDDLPAGLLEFLRESRQADGYRRCLDPVSQCAVWISDINQDGQDEAILVSSSNGRWIHGSWLLVYESGKWRLDANLNSSLSLAEWRSMVADGKIIPQQPVWPELMADGRLIQINRLSSPDR